MAKSKLKSDQYKKNRGGYSRLMDISCEGCGTHLCFYQKDGPGILKRMYLDRIYKSDSYSGLEHTKLSKLPQLICKECGRHLGMPINYEKENRSAFRLFQGSVIKKIASTKSL